MRVGHGFAAAIDAHDLLLGRVDAAGENAGLDRRLDSPPAARHRRAPRGGATPRAAVVPVRRGRPGRPADARPPRARDVVRGVAGAARQHLGRVVFENQHRRFARHARDAAVDELVGDQIAEDTTTRGVGEAVDEVEASASDLTLRASATARSRSPHPAAADLRITDDRARMRLSQIASVAATSAGPVRFLRAAVAGADQNDRRADGVPQLHVAPLIADDPGRVSDRGRDARGVVDHARCRLAAARRVRRTPASSASG